MGKLEFPEAVFNSSLGDIFDLTTFRPWLVMSGLGNGVLPGHQSLPNIGTFRDNSAFYLGLSPCGARVHWLVLFRKALSQCLHPWD